ncbi:MAG: sigma-54 dependent transcriptional regulator [Desulfovermiculus sp.]|nr:sigma-54 dependent transcriptional regulator [Desulfovermiculus sp.]
MKFSKPSIIGSSPAIRKVLDMTEKVSNVDLNVLITGETGVGKELVARTLHAQSQRNGSPFIKINCAAMPSELLETELFGYEKGAFTGADKPKTGKFEAAKSGTIFLDEIGELPTFMQAKLLQVLQDMNFYRVGGHQETAVHARVIAATNIDVHKMIEKGVFRSDLFHRLNTITIHIPALRDRPEDILPLTHYFIQETARKYNLPKAQLSIRLMNLFQKHSWPGNIRELENYIKQLSILENYREIEDEILALQGKATVPQETKSPETLQDISSDTVANIKDMLKNGSFASMKDIRESIVKKVEKDIIQQTLHETGWNRKEASKILRLSYRAMLYKIKEYELSPYTFRRVQTAPKGQSIHTRSALDGKVASAA